MIVVNPTSYRPFDATPYATWAEPPGRKGNSWDRAAGFRRE
jgi:hypothetical protein